MLGRSTKIINHFYCVPHQRQLQHKKLKHLLFHFLAEGPPAINNSNLGYILIKKKRININESQNITHNRN